MSVKIRVSIPVTVRSQDPKPKRTNLYHIVILCVSQPETVAACQVRPFILLFGEMANHLGWGAPKHIALMTC